MRQKSAAQDQTLSALESTVYCDTGASCENSKNVACGHIDNIYQKRKTDIYIELDDKRKLDIY